MIDTNRGTSARKMGARMMNDAVHLTYADTEWRRRNDGVMMVAETSSAMIAGRHKKLEYHTLYFPMRAQSCVPSIFLTTLFFVLTDFTN